MKVSLDQAIWKAKVLKNGQMAEGMKATLKMVKRMEKELLNGPMETNILEVGKMVNNMVLQFGIVQKKDLKDKESGLMVKGQNGYKA